MNEKSSTTEPLVISSKAVEQFEQLFPEWKGLMKFFEEKGLVIIKP